MRTKRFWDNRYNDFCDKVLCEKIRLNQSFMDDVKDEMVRSEEFFNESLENGEEKAKETVLFCYINHELNLLDPIGVCYPGIINEYSSYAWGMVEALLTEGKESFPQQFKARLRTMYSCVHSPLERKVLETTCRKITNTINKIFNSLEFVQNLHKNQFSANLFWKKQMTNFQYLVLAKERKEYAAAITFCRKNVISYFMIKKKTWLKTQKTLYYSCT